MIYLDHASTTRCSVLVQEIIAQHLESTWGNPNSIHSKGLTSKTALIKAATDIKRFLGTDKGTIIWTSGGTDANVKVVKALSPGLGQLALSRLEHKSLDQFRREGKTISLDQDSVSEIVEPRHVYNTVSKYTTLASVMFVNNEFGTENSIEDIALAVHEKNSKTLFHSDCTAAITKSPLSLEDSKIDLVTISAHKIYGPKGIGCLWVRDKLVAEKINANLYRGTLDPINIIGFAQALNSFNLKEEKTLTNEQATLFLEGLNGINFQVLGNPLRSHNSTMSIYFEDIDAVTLVMELSDRGVFCSHGSACGTKESTRVLEAAGYPKEIAMCTVRFSFGKMVNLVEIKEAAKIVKETIKELKNADY